MKDANAAFAVILVGSTALYSTGHWIGGTFLIGYLIATILLETFP